MKKLLIILSLLLLYSCAPTATFISYDIYDNHTIVYGKDKNDKLPPDIPVIGESWIYYIGVVKRTYKPKGKFNYTSSVIIIDEYDYDVIFNIKGKINILNGTRCYLMRENDNGDIKNYLINDGKRYLMD